MAKRDDFLNKLAPRADKQLDKEVGADQPLDKKSLKTMSVQLRKPLWKKLKILSVEKEKSMVDLLDKCVRYGLKENIFKN